MYSCDKCGGISSTSYLCENPCCPLMPCCNKEEEQCICEFDIPSIDFRALEKAYNQAVLSKETAFLFNNQKIFIAKAKFILDHIN